MDLSSTVQIKYNALTVWTLNLEYITVCNEKSAAFFEWKQTPMSTARNNNAKETNFKASSPCVFVSGSGCECAGVVCCLYLRVTLHSVDECFISYNLCVSIEKGLEAILGLLKLLLGYLWRQGQTVEKNVSKQGKYSLNYIEAFPSCLPLSDFQKLRSVQINLSIAVLGDLLYTLLNEHWTFPVNSLVVLIGSTLHPVLDSHHPADE